jgi:hypothetical protein
MKSIIIEKIIADIIKKQLDLPDFYNVVSTSKTPDQIPSIFIGNQNLKLYYTDKLQVVVRSVDSPKIIANNSQTNFETTPATELQSVVMLESIQVDLMSRNNEARDRRYEVVTALKSYYAQQQQDYYQFRLFEHSLSLVNTGEAEGGSQLNRWTMVFPVHVIYNKTINISTYDYYRDFTATYIDENISDINHPAFSFEISGL